MQPLSFGDAEAIDMAKKDMTFDGLQPNSLVLNQRAKNNEIKLGEDPWGAKRIDGDRWLVNLSYQQEGQWITHHFDCNIATGVMKHIPPGATPPR